MPAIYSHPRLMQLIQQLQPEYHDALDAVQDAHTLVRDMNQALRQAEKQLAQAQEQLQQTIPAQHEHRLLVRKLQAMQCACWNRSLSAELSGPRADSGQDLEVQREDDGRIVPTAARHSQRSGADQVRDFAVVTSADCCWRASHVVREFGGADFGMGLE